MNPLISLVKVEQDKHQSLGVYLDRILPQMSVSTDPLEIDRNLVGTNLSVLFKQITNPELKEETEGSLLNLLETIDTTQKNYILNKLENFAESYEGMTYDEVKFPHTSMSLFFSMSQMSLYVYKNVPSNQESGGTDICIAELHFEDINDVKPYFKGFLETYFELRRSFIEEVLAGVRNDREYVAKLEEDEEDDLAEAARLGGIKDEE